MTEITKMNYAGGKEIREAPKYQVELEIKNRKLDNNKIFDEIVKQLIIILGLINS